MTSHPMWAVAGGVIPLDDPVVMGILNVTPDSFSDGGENENVDAAVATGIAMSIAGARIIDVGGESTRPGADIVPADIEIQRILPVVERLAAEDITVSIDTSKVEVAEAALSGGAVVVNDVTGLADPAMARLCALAGAGVVVMHMQGNPRTMLDDPQYEDVVSEVTEFLVERARTSEDAGISRDAIVIDPGIGFGKTLEHNLALMNGIGSLTSTGYPVLVGPSRKGFLGKILEPTHGPTTPAERDGPTAGAVAVAIARGASIVRVHNVPLALEVANTVKAIVRGGGLTYRNG